MSITSSGDDGSSYGSSTPVNPVISPFDDPLVQPLHVAPRTLLDRSPHEHLHERPPLLDERTRLVSRLARRARSPRRSPRRRAASAATPPSRSVRCSCRDPASRSRAPLRSATAPCRRRGTRRPMPAPLQLRADEMRDRRLPCAGQAGQPERESAAAAALRLRVLVRIDVLAHFILSAAGFCTSGASRWIPHSSLSEPAQWPARSSSSGAVGRVQGCSRSSGSPSRAAGCRGSRSRGCRPRRASRPSRRAGGPSRRRSAPTTGSFGVVARLGDWSRRMPAIPGIIR